ncbi:MAG: hypothetical protein HYX61_10750 [Gammaproteobacteria bacterium]|jgi:hypothetical protein|nr:hypothetical protein [Gammaproteobacteria bacterium]
MIYKGLHLILAPLTLYLLCAISHAAVDKADELPTKLETLVVTHFKQFCVDGVNDFSKTQSLAQTMGFPEEKNEFVKANPNDKRWVIYSDNDSLTRVNLILKNKSCMISAITGKKNIIHQGDDQTPIEHYLINTLGTVLIKRQREGEQITRIFDSNYQGKTSTIILKNEVFPSKKSKGAYFYQVILTLKPY